MPYINLSGATFNNGVHIGKYKDQKSFIEIHNNAVQRIVLESASHFFGESLWQIDMNEIFIYTEVNPAESKELLEKQRIIDEQWKRINQYAADEDENKRGKLIAERILKEKTDRHNAQLRAIFYMLDQIAKVGTHHEKEVVIRYIRQSIHGYLKADGLDQYGCDDLPF